MVCNVRHGDETLTEKEKFTMPEPRAITRMTPARAIESWPSSSGRRYDSAVTKDEKHRLERQYGLNYNELLDAMDRRFRAKVTLEGAVAEVQMAKRIKALQDIGVVARFDERDEDGVHDFDIWLPNRKKVIRAECKNVRDHDEAFRVDGQIVAYKVETQKTRTSQGDASSRYYGVDQFDILGVCLGKKTGDWTQFLYTRVKNLAKHKTHAGKLAAIQRVPLPAGSLIGGWTLDFRALLDEIRREPDAA